MCEMSQHRRDTIRIVDKIHKAFSDVDYPVNMQIISELDDSLEAQELRDSLRGKNWRDIDAVFLNKYCIQGIFFLEFQAYRYFLPAFLLASVNEYDRCFDITKDILTTLLQPVTRQEMFRSGARQETVSDLYSFTCRMRGLTCLQVEVIVDYLKFLCDYHLSDFPDNEPRLALDEYWLERMKKEDAREGNNKKL